jgi:pimeloyl-ACP methyl ester carboxylesterase
VLLIHGYGASAYHWRYQIPALAQQGYRVYALDLLGFGWSEKALVDYSSGGLWGQQIDDFVQQVIRGDAASSSSGGGSNGGSSNGSRDEQVVLVGNSLGGYACMNAAVKNPELFR